MTRYDILELDRHHHLIPQIQKVDSLESTMKSSSHHAILSVLTIDDGMSIAWRHGNPYLSMRTESII
jgi:hypothetical protein